jgi:glyoxylase-like metal-dependent hydrolase (beta-lactamase superfamily II)
MVCHVLLIESPDGLVLVDTGFGMADVMEPRVRLGRAFVGVTRPRLRPEDTAVKQLVRLGFDPTDVRHIVVTHLDLDHAGGLSDFPHARVHLYAREHEAAMARATFNERNRYRRRQWAHEPLWSLHDPAAPGGAGERWHGFDGVRAINALGPDLLIVPTVGHTRGHSAIAVRSDHGWLLHAGDAYFHRGEMDTHKPHCPAGLALFERVMAVDNAARAQNVERLRTLVRDQADAVRVFSAHDQVELEALATLAGTASMPAAASA